MSKCRSTLQQYFLSVKRSGKQHKISYQLLSTSWGGWDEGFVEYKLTCHWKQWQALASPLRQVKMLEILVHSSIRWLAQAPLYLELRAGLQSWTEHTHLKSRNQEFFAKGAWEGKNNATLNTLVYPKESGKKISKSSTQGAAKEARDHTIIDRSCMFCTVWETFGHNLGLNHNLGMGFRRGFKTDLSRERAQLRDGGVTNCGQFGKISARPLSLFLSWTEFIVSVVLQV